MNRSEFIREIMSLYPNIFDVNNEAQFMGWIDKYQILPESWNFDKLMNIFATKWNSVREAPPPSWFLSFREDVRPERIETVEKVEVSEEERENIKKIIDDFRKRQSKFIEEHKI